MVEWSNYRIVEFANYLSDVILIPTKKKKEEAKLPLFLCYTRAITVLEYLHPDHPASFSVLSWI